MRASILEKDAKLNRQVVLNSTAVSVRDNLRSEVGQVRLLWEEAVSDKKR
jgi:hypothetical protein